MTCARPELAEELWGGGTSRENANLASSSAVSSVIEIIGSDSAENKLRQASLPNRAPGTLPQDEGAVVSEELGEAQTVCLERDLKFFLQGVLYTEVLCTCAWWVVHIFSNKCDFKAMHRSALCRSRRELSNEYLFNFKLWLRYSRERVL